MQDPNEDTEWNDVLRAKGIIPQKEKEVTEEDLVNMIQDTIDSKGKAKDMAEMGLDELDELEDEVDEDEQRIFEQYRRQRMAELAEARTAARYGSVLEITKADWVEHINKAPADVWVIAHVYGDGIPLCALMNQHLSALANKFPGAKFCRGRSAVCIEGYPEKNLPTLFVYKEGKLRKQWIGALDLRADMNTTQDDVEWLLGGTGAVPTQLEEAPRRAPQDLLDRAVSQANDDDNDW